MKSSKAGWFCMAFSQKPLKAGVPVFGASPSTCGCHHKARTG